MLDPMNAFLITRQRHEELVREAAAARLAGEALAPRAASTSAAAPSWRQLTLAWTSIIERFRVGTRLESRGG